jgi:hypothetical protein
MSPEAWQPILAAHWRVKNGLEHRALVCLLRAPRALEEARSRLLPSDFLTPAYAALAALLLDQALGAKAAEVAKRGISGRPYLPDPERFDWDAEATVTVARLIERRSRWRQERRGLQGGCRG